VPDIPQGWATIDAAVIGVVGAGLMTMLGIVLRRLKHVREDTATTVYHVANEHKDDRGDPINFRDDTDAKHAELVELVTEVATRVEGIDGRIDEVERNLRGVQKDIGRLSDADLEHVRSQNRARERLDEIERTWPKWKRHDE
jgi:hypothetical protein